MEFTQEQIKKYLGKTEGELNDAGICPTCFNRATNCSLFGDESQKKFFEDQDIECVFVSNPRADGHVAIITKEHFDDMTKCPNQLNHKIMDFAKALMTIIKEVFGCEKVYLCTMCDGPQNHYHVQLIPRYAFEQRGSKNFVKPRKEYVFDENKFNLIKERTQTFAKNINIPTFVWHDGEPPKDMQIKQVYAVAFDKKGRVLIRQGVEHGKPYSNLAGGTPESFDKDRIDTLRREYLEEVNTTLKDPIYMLGYQTVNENNGKPLYAQIRMTAMIDQIGPKQPDPDCGEIYDRLLTTPQRAIELLNWKGTGDLMINSAVKIAKEKFGIKEFCDEEEYV